MHDTSSHGFMIGRRPLLAGLSACALPILLPGFGGPISATRRADASVIQAADFRRDGLSDREVLERAFAAWMARGGALHLEPGHIYNLGQQRGGNIFVLFGLREATLAGNGATLRLRSTGNEAVNILYLAYYRGLRIENLNATDLGYRGHWEQGARFVVLDTGQADSEEITLDNLGGERLLAFVQVQGPVGRHRVRGIRIEPNCRATRVFYGLNCQDQGDGITGGYTATNCARAYFPYGVSDHDLAIRIHHDGRQVAEAAETAVLIKSYGRATSRIRANVAFSGTLPWMTIDRGHQRAGSCVTIEHQHDPNLGASVIEDIDVTINVAAGTEDPYGTHRLLLRSYYADGTEETGRTANIWRRIRIGGNLRPGAAPAIVANVIPTTPADITLAPGALGLDAGQIVAPGFRFSTK